AADPAAAIELFAVPVGEQHPCGCRVGCGGRGWAGAVACFSYGAVSYGPDGDGARRDDRAGGAGRYREFYVAAMDGSVRLRWRTLSQIVLSFWTQKPQRLRRKKTRME